MAGTNAGGGDATPYLFDNPAVSDVKLKQVYNGQTREYHAHKAILISRSPYFSRAFTGGFKEATSNVMELHEDDPEDFALALKYIYTMSDNVEALGRLIKTTDCAKRVNTAVGVSIVADKYAIKGLEEAAAHDIRSWLLAERDPEGKILAAAIDKYYEVRSDADSPVGKALSTISTEDRRGFTTKPTFIQAMKQNIAFAADMALRAWEGPDAVVHAQYLHTCTCCSRKFSMVKKEGLIDPTTAGIPWYCPWCRNRQHTT